jgi:hypothetical protein
VDDGPIGPELPFVDIVEGETATVTVVNDGSDVLPATTSADGGAAAGGVVTPRFTG